MAGLHTDTLSGRRFLNVVYALLIDEPDGLVNREEVRTKVDTEFEKLQPDRKTWGTGKRAAEGQRALMAMLEESS